MAGLLISSRFLIAIIAICFAAICNSSTLRDHPQNCDDVVKSLSSGAKNDVYRIFPSGSKDGINVYCDFPNEQEAWTVIQRRVDGSLSFSRGWAEYENGFGNLSSEFWLGLKDISDLTVGADMSLRVELTDWQDNQYYAEYSHFRLDNSTYDYQLNIDDYVGDAGDGLQFNNGMYFSTWDKDNDVWPVGDCSAVNEGACWYRDCSFSNLNGNYEERYLYNGVRWSNRGINPDFNCKRTEMKIRRRVEDCRK